MTARVQLYLSQCRRRARAESKRYKNLFSWLLAVLAVFFASSVVLFMLGDQERAAGAVAFAATLAGSPFLAYLKSRRDEAGKQVDKYQALVGQVCGGVSVDEELAGPGLAPNLDPHDSSR